MPGSDGMKPIAVEVKEDGATAKVLAKEATLATIASSQTDKTQFTKITDGTETWLIDTSGRGLVAGDITPTDGLTTPTTAVNANSFLNGVGLADGLWHTIGAIAGNADGILIGGGQRLLLNGSWNFGYNGTTYDRLRSVNTGQLVTTVKNSSGVEIPLDSTNGVDVDVTRTNSDETYHNETAVRTVFGRRRDFTVHLDAENISATTGFMLIDLSDTTNWPHTNTGHIVLDLVCINSDPSTSFTGDVQFGFLSNVDGTDGDFHVLYTIHYAQGSAVSEICLDFKGLGCDLEVDDWFGPTVANDTTFQTDVNIQGPNGATSFPSGAGDFVMKIVPTAGNIDVGVTLKYTTVA